MVYFVSILVVSALLALGVGLIAATLRGSAGSILHALAGGVAAPTFVPARRIQARRITKFARLQPRLRAAA